MGSNPQYRIRTHGLKLTVHTKGEGATSLDALIVVG